MDSLEAEGVETRGEEGEPEGRDTVSNSGLETPVAIEHSNPIIASQN